MRRFLTMSLTLLVTIVVLIVVNLLIGTVAIPVADVCRILAGMGSDSEIWTNIVLSSRLPQVLTAIVAGAGLAVSGLQMQTVFRNPLAGPSVLGISNGSALGVAFVVLLSGQLGGVALSRLGYLGDVAISVAAIVGALAVLMLIIWISQRVKGNVTLLIIGVMIGYLANAIIGVLKFLSPEEDVKAFRPACPSADHCLFGSVGSHRDGLLRPHHVHWSGSTPSGSCLVPHQRPSSADACHSPVWSSLGTGVQLHCPHAGLRRCPACQQCDGAGRRSCHSECIVPSSSIRRIVSSACGTNGWQCCKQWCRTTCTKSSILFLGMACHSSRASV